MRQRTTAPAPRRSTTRRSASALPRLLGLLLAGSTQPAWADCTVTTTGLVFGAYDPFAAQPVDGAGSVLVDCTSAVSYVISLSAGAGSYALRTMLSGSDRLDYNLYGDSTRTSVWGDGSAGTVTVAGNATSANHTVYGRIPARQNVRAGSYADSIVVTLTF